MPWYIPVRHPVFWEEVRRRLRGARGYWVLLGYGLALIVLMGLLSATQTDLADNPARWAEFGKTLWLSFLLGQAVLLLLICPALAAGAISTEREAGTLELLFLTPITVPALVLGKFFGAIGQLLVVLLSGLPIIASVFVFGGVSPGEVVVGYLLLLLLGVYCALFGFLASCLCTRAIAATIWAYAFLLIALIGLPLLGVVLAMFSLSDVDTYMALLAPAPTLAMACFSESTTSVPFEIWTPLLVLLGECAVILFCCILRLHHLRGTTPRFYQQLSPDAARRASSLMRRL